MKVTWTATVALAAMVLTVMLGDTAVGSSPALKMTMTIKKAEYLVGENVDVDVTFLNEGSTAAKLPDPSVPGVHQPVYTLTGPDYPGGIRFIASGSHEHGPRRQPDEKPERVVDLASLPAKTIAAGGKIVLGVRLQRQVHLHTPGDYTLTAAIGVPGVSLKADPVSFRILANRFIAGSTAFDLTRPKVVRTAWIGEGDGVRRIGSGLIMERRPDLGEVDPGSVRSGRNVGPAAFEPFTPSSAVDRAEVPVSWLGWREGSRVYAAVFQAPAQQAELAADALLLQPTVLLPSGELQLLAVTSGGTRLSHYRFTPDRTGKAQPVVSHRDLKGMAVRSAAACLGSSADGADAHVVLVAGSENSVRLTLVTADESGPVRSAEAQGVTPLAGSTPAVQRDNAGRVKASVVVAVEGKPRSFAVVDATSEPGGKDGSAVVTPIGVIPDYAGFAAAAYPAAVTASLERDWVILLKDDKVLTSLLPEDPVELRFEPARPLQLTKRPQASYLLLVDPEHGPALHPLL